MREGRLSELDALPSPTAGGHGTGIALRAAGGRIDLVVAAIRDDNAPVDLVVLDHGTSVEVRTRGRGRLRVTASTLRWHLGRRFGTADLQAMILWIDGELVSTGDRVTITAGRNGTAGPGHRRSPNRPGQT